MNTNNFHVECNICGSMSFQDLGERRNVRCLQCYSLERTRVTQLFIDKYSLVQHGTKVLHVAPDNEIGLAERLNIASGENCKFIDINPVETGAFTIEKMDLCKDLEAINNYTYDLIIHNHVLEHLYCNYVYVLYHLHRILRVKGKMLFSVPIIPGYFKCDMSLDMSENERINKFGLRDHTSRFGRKDIQLQLGKLYNLPDVYDLTKIFHQDDLMKYNIPTSSWVGYTPDFVFMVGRKDFLLR